MSTKRTTLDTQYNRFDAFRDVTGISLAAAIIFFVLYTTRPDCVSQVGVRSYVYTIFLGVENVKNAWVILIVSLFFLSFPLRDLIAFVFWKFRLTSEFRSIQIASSEAFMPSNARTPFFFKYLVFYPLSAMFSAFGTYAVAINASCQ